VAAHLGIDIGTTTITCVAFDTSRRQLVGLASAANDTETTSPSDRQRGRSEWDLDAMLDRALGVVSEVAGALAGPVDGIGVTGQMHGMALVSPDGRAASPFIGWQDQRCLNEYTPGRTYVDHIAAAAAGMVVSLGCTPATGYMGATLLWLRANGALPAGARACFAADSFVRRLTAGPTVTDPTNAASAGMFDVIRGGWHSDLVSALGLDGGVLPEVLSSCSQAGALCPDVAHTMELPSGTPVAVACGDNQASFAGSVADAASAVLVNVGTGGQVSAHTGRPVTVPGMDLRPYLDGCWLVVGAGLCGGASLAILRDFFIDVGQSLFGVAAPKDIYDRLTMLAADVPYDAEGLRLRPTFRGSRAAPELRAELTGLSDRNFTARHLTRALLTGLGTEFRSQYDDMVGAGLSSRQQLVGSGNAVRLNPVLRSSLSTAFSMPCHTPPMAEEAALGAALTSAVAVGEYASILAASADTLS